MLFRSPRPAARGRRKPADGGAAGASGLAPARPEAGEAAAEMATPKKRAPARRKPAAAVIAPAESIGDGGEGAGE